MTRIVVTPRDMAWASVTARVKGNFVFDTYSFLSSSSPSYSSLPSHHHVDCNDSGTSYSLLVKNAR